MESICRNEPNALMDTNQIIERLQEQADRLRKNGWPKLAEHNDRIIEKLKNKREK
jgi:uncharacterized protein YaaN involved in tellurite resistance